MGSAANQKPSASAKEHGGYQRRPLELCGAWQLPDASGSMFRSNLPLILRFCHSRGCFMKFSVRYLITTVAILLAIGQATASAAERVAFHRQSPTQLQIQIDGKAFGTLNHGGDWRKPFLFPVHAPNGKNVLRDIIPTKDQQGSSKDGTDHFHHKGVWVAVDSVNDEKLNFWHESDLIRCDSVNFQGSEDSGQIVIRNSWMQGDLVLASEVTTVTIYPSRLLTYHIELSAIEKDVTFHDTKEGFFAVRVAHTMREMEGGSIVNAEGLKGSGDCWGKPSPWIDYYGPVEGETCGVTLMDHPDNFRESRYHVRGYGLFGISPFGPKTYSSGKQPVDPVTLTPGGDKLTLDYGLYVHDGDTRQAKVAEIYDAFLAATKR